LLPKTATISNEFIVKFRPFEKVECYFDIVAVFSNNVAVFGNNIEAICCRFGNNAGVDEALRTVDGSSENAT